MVVVRHLVLVLFGAVAAVAVVVTGIYGYHLIVTTAIPAATPDLAAILKTDAESILFAAIVAATVIALILLAILSRSLYLSRELDKIVEMSRYRDFSPEVSLKRLGRIGDRLSSLYHNANAVSESKTRKIGALSDLNSFLVRNVSAPLVVFELPGNVVHASRGFEERIGAGRTELLSATVTTLFPDLAWNEVEIELLRRRTPVARKTGIGEMTFYPIEDRADEIAYIVCSLEKPEKVWLPEKMRHALERADNPDGAKPESQFGHAVASGLRGIMASFRRGRSKKEPKASDTPEK
ncbi:MAG TPA: PAS domain-containing protein [Spirochaetia bacterium]|nr:PAS domain-containing protein [Spirochaetia bacterium]